jgi:hypothetical protein
MVPNDFCFPKVDSEEHCLGTLLRAFLPVFYSLWPVDTPPDHRQFISYSLALFGDLRDVL